MDIQIIASSSTGNCYRVDDILIDPGIPMGQIKKALKYNLSGLSGCLCSHGHEDHSAYAKHLLKSFIDVYASQETTDKRHLSGAQLHVIEDSKQFNVGAWSIKPFSLVHDSPNLGFLMARGSEKLVYIIDTNYVPQVFRGLTHVMIGVNYCKDILRENVERGSIDIGLANRILSNHMSIQTAVEFFEKLDKSKLQAVFLLHLSDRNSHERRFKETIQKIVGCPVYTGDEKDL
jgi:phosphoribosyl 1,2-cyclic phosphodiesterase